MPARITGSTTEDAKGAKACPPQWTAAGPRRPRSGPGVRRDRRGPNRRGRAFAAALLLLVPAATAAQAPAALIGKPIAEVRLVVDARPVDDQALRRVIDTREGAPLSAADVRESILHLMALRRFADVQVSAEPAAGGVSLTYSMTPREVITGMDFQGDLGLSERRLRATVIERWAGTPPLERAADAAADLDAFLRERGYRNAKVSARTRPEPNYAATLVFDVKAGQRVRVASLHVNGAPGGVAEVASSLGVAVGTPFDSAVVQDRVEQYTDALRSRGYFDARVDLSTSYSPDGLGVDVTVDVERGPHVSLVFRGDPIPQEKRDEVLPLNREGGLDEDRLEDASLEFERYLRGQGYREATAPYTREQGPNGETLLVFTIHRGPQYKIAGRAVEGASQVPLSALTPLLATAEGQWFVQSRLDGDVARLAEEYRRRGFRDVKVSAAVTPQPSSAALLDVRFTIVEGERLLVRDIVFAGNQELPATLLRPAVQSLPGGPFYQPQVNADRDAVLRLYVERGYQLASVEVTADRQPQAGGVDLRFDVHEGPRSVIDRVLVVGNERTSALAIERETGLVRGMPITPDALTEARRRLGAMALFRRVQITELQLGSSTERDVLVEVEEGPVNTIGYGGGLEGANRLRRDLSTGGTVERFEVAPRGFFEISRRNLWGRNRTVTLFARGAIRSSDQVNPPDGGAPAVNPLEQDGGGFHEYRLLGTYREPNFADLPFDLAVTGVVEQAIRSSFDFNRRQAYAEGRHLFNRFSVAGRYSIGKTRIFNDRIDPDDRPNIDRLFNPGVRLSTFSGSVAHDTRNDPLSPTGGSLQILDTSLAARAVGSDVGFVRVYGQSFFFREVPHARGTVFAAGVRFGLANGFPRTVEQVDADGNPVLDPDGNPVMVEVEDVPASERFFAGGDTTVRGFSQDQLGAADVLDRNGVSKGGKAVLILNGELRFPILSGIGLGGAAFVDIGNVYAEPTSIDLGQLRTGVGFGIRWNSPVGPLRVDLGWKVTRHTFQNGEREPGFAPYITIGQAF